jgi:hypothetical protein
MERDKLSSYMTDEELVMDAVHFVQTLTGLNDIDPFKINPKTKKHSRSRNLVVARHLIRYYLVKRFKLGWSYVGRITNCDHATVIWSIKYVDDLASYDKGFSMYKSAIILGINNPHLSLREKMRAIILRTRVTESKINDLICLFNEEVKITLENYELETRKGQSAAE